MGRRARIAVPAEEVEAFCKKNGIRKLSFFGSVLRDDFDGESDVDVLVEFLTDKVVGFLGLAAMEMELSHILGRKADLRTLAGLSRYFRQEVCDSAEVCYAEG